MRRQQVIYYGASLMVLIGLVAVILYLMFVPRISIEQARRDIDLSVPVGSSKTNAKRWLMSQSHIHYRGEFADKETGRVEGIGAYIPESGPRWETPERIEIWFYFENDKLSRVQMERRKTPYVFP